MVKKAILLALAAFVMVTALSPAPAHTQGGLAVLSNSAEVEFPTHLSFSITAESNADITDIRLKYVVDRMSFARVTSEAYIEFEPSTRVDVSWDLEIVKAGGPPVGTEFWYWWSVEDAEGSRAETEPEVIRYDDSRFQWRHLDEGNVSLYWYEQDESFAGELMDTAQEALARLAEDTGARLERPVDIYIYADTQDMLGAMLHPQAWTGGVSYNGHNTILIGVSENNLDWGKETIAHELTHVVVEQITYNPYNAPPRWLNEGLAKYNEGGSGAVHMLRITNAIDDGSLISVRSLSGPFSAVPERAFLAYAQSYSLVDYLIASYGTDDMLALLSAFQDGIGYDEALEQVYGFDVDGLDARWRDYIGAPEQQAEAVVAR